MDGFAVVVGDAGKGERERGGGEWVREMERKREKRGQGEREENLGASLASGLLGTADSLRGYFKV